MVGSASSRAPFWAFGGLAASQLLRLGGNLVLWRLLYPEAFGLMALVSAFLQGIHMFSDLGITPSIVQNPRGDEPAFLNTAWTIQVVRGLSMAAVITVTAPFVGDFYNEPLLGEVLPIVGIGAIFDGCTATRVHTQSRHGVLGRLTLMRLFGQTVGLVAMIAFAYTYRSIWALVIGNLLGQATDLLLGHLILPGERNRLRWEPSSARALIHFGRWVFLSTLLTFAAMQSDRLIFGKLIPLKLLGVYGIALAWSSIAGMVAERIFDGVVFPRLSRLQNASADVGAHYRSQRLPWLTLCAWILSCLIAGGPAIIRLLYDERASEAEWILQILAVGGWLSALSAAAIAALLALGKPNVLAAGSALKLVGMIVCILAGMRLYGFPGALIGFVASDLLRYAVLTIGLRLSGVSVRFDDVGLTAGLAVASGAGVLASSGLRTLALTEAPKLAAFLEGALVFVVVTSLWAIVFMAQRRRLRPAE